MKTAYLVLTLTIATFILNACSRENNEIAPVRENTDMLFFKTSTPASAGNHVAGWLVDDVIGISVYRANTNDIYSDNNHKQYVTNGDGVFAPVLGSNGVAYPANGDTVDIVAYYPYQENITDNLYQIDLSEQSQQRAIDFLYSNNIKNTNTETKLVFSHQLSKIRINATPGNGITKEDIAGLSISITGVYSNATFNLRDGTLLPYGEKTFLKMKTDKDSDQSEAIVLPCSSDNVEIKVVLSNGTTYVSKFSDIDFEAGRVHQYTLTVHKAKISISSSIITDWEGLEEPPGGGFTEDILYQVGDYYPNPSDPSTAIGVVFWTTPGYEGRAGKILSFDTSIGAWSIENSFPTTISSIINGVLNMAVAKAFSQTLDRFPAFKKKETTGIFLHEMNCALCVNNGVNIQT